MPGRNRQLMSHLNVEHGLYHSDGLYFQTIVIKYAEQTSGKKTVSPKTDIQTWIQKPELLPIIHKNCHSYRFKECNVIIIQREMLINSLKLPHDTEFKTLPLHSYIWG
jgi:hypothetical protein